MEQQTVLWLIAVVSGCFAAFLDWKYREVPNRLWILAIALSTPLLLMEAWESFWAFSIRVLLAACSFGVFYFLWWSKVIGGADAKGFSVFALLLSPIGYWDPLSGKIYPALDILLTAMIFGAAFNLISRRLDNKIPLFVSALGPLFVASAAGGLVWWPFLWLVKLSL